MSFDIIKHRFDEPIIIVPLADVHLGSKECDEERFADLIATIENTPNMYCFLMGDLVDNGVKSSVTNVYEALYQPHEQKQRAVMYLKPIRNKILAAVSGNHENRNAREVDNDITRDILCKLDIEDLYRRDMAFISIGIGHKMNEGKDQAKYTYNFCITHGSSDAKRDKFAPIVDGLDCLVTGHTHRSFVERRNKLCIDNQNSIVTEKPLVIVNAESWVRYGGYAARKMLLPHEHSNIQKIMLKSTEKQISTIW